MKRSTVLIVQICMVLLAVLIVISCVVYAEDEPQPKPPMVNTEGLCCPAKVAAVKIEKPAYTMYYTAKDAETIAKAVWGEARGCTLEGQAKVVWVILNRVDDNRFPDTIQGVVTQPCQFYGYSPNFPVTPEILSVVNDVLYRWNAEKNGIAVTRELDSTFVYFTGDGAQNYFRVVY